MRWSISTRIFVFFTVVIMAFGGASAYTVYRMTSLRASFTLLWEDAMPIATRLKSLSRRLQAPEEFLEMKRSSDALWVSRLLPRLEPFRTIRQVEDSLTDLLEADQLSDADRKTLEGVVTRLSEFRTGPELREAIAKGERLSRELADVSNSENLYHELVAKTVSLAAKGELSLPTEESYVTVRALRQINRVVIESARAIAEPLKSLQTRAADDEKAARLAVLVIGIGATLLSLVMLLMVQLTLRPIRRLREGARHIAAGDYDERVQVRSRDEIGQLADEFNTMAIALQERDEALARQRKELLRTDRLATIGKMAAQVTHEVRNPLSSIGLNAELLEEELRRLSGEEALSLLGAIQGEVRRLESITEEYLRYARLPTPDRELVDLVEVIEGFSRFVAGEMEYAEIDLQLKIPPPGPGFVIRGDRDQIRQGLLNLIRNAKEALLESPSPRVIELYLSPLTGGGSEVVVQDNGQGLDASVREQIFDPFVTTKEGGTGLGLALTRQIMHGHGGTLTGIEREDGASGARFVLTFPYKREDHVVVEESG